MDFINKNRKELQLGGGICITLLCSVILNRQRKLASFLFKNYASIANTTIDLKHIIKNPGALQYVLLKNLSCTSSPELFKNHMKLMDREMISSAKQFCFKRASDNFKGYLGSNAQKYEVNCDCSTFHPYVSSSILINNYDLIKKIGKKPKLTMIACGFITYNASQKQFRFFGESYGTTTEQIEWVWGKVLRKNMYLLFAYGVMLGIGVRLCFEHVDTVYDYFEVNKQQN